MITPLEMGIEQMNLQRERSRKMENSDTNNTSRVDSTTTGLSLSHPSYTRPPQDFPKRQPPPPGLPIRVDMSSARFRALDAVYEKKLHPVLNEQIKTAETDESCCQEALDRLRQHVRDRIPYVQVANNSLQAILNMRNDRVFELPSIEQPKKKRVSFGGLAAIPEREYGGNTNAGTAAKAAMRGDLKTFSNVLVQDRRRDNKIHLGGINHPRSPMPSVDSLTGSGLKDFLLSKGKEHGMRKRECGSITICDFTPDMRTNNHRNVLMGHWSVEKGEKINVYEIELPTTMIHGQTGRERSTTETWLCFFISHPVVSFSTADLSTSTRRPQLSWNSRHNRSIHPLSSQHPISQAPLYPVTSSQPPPNFPHPIPDSWLAFACSLAHVTCHPEKEEHFDEIERNNPTKETDPSDLSCKTEKVYKRADFDLSHCGIPIFEFSSTNLFPTVRGAERIEFLSVDDISGWDETDKYVAFSDEEYENFRRQQAEELWASSRNHQTEPTDPSVPCPNKGIWWGIFWQRMYEDARRWKKIKQAMGRGNCRVVVRWVEMKLSAVDEREEGVGLGIALDDTDQKSSKSLKGRDSGSQKRCRATGGVAKRPEMLGDATIVATAHEKGIAREKKLRERHSY